MTGDDVRYLTADELLRIRLGDTLLVWPVWDLDPDTDQTLHWGPVIFVVTCWTGDTTVALGGLTRQGPVFSWVNRYVRLLNLFRRLATVDGPRVVDTQKVQARASERMVTDELCRRGAPLATAHDIIVVEKDRCRR